MPTPLVCIPHTHTHTHTHGLKQQHIPDPVHRSDCTITSPPPQNASFLPITPPPTCNGTPATPPHPPTPLLLVTHFAILFPPIHNTTSNRIRTLYEPNTFTQMNGIITCFALRTARLRCHAHIYRRGLVSLRLLALGIQTTYSTSCSFFLFCTHTFYETPTLCCDADRRILKASAEGGAGTP